MIEGCRRYVMLSRVIGGGQYKGRDIKYMIPDTF